MKERVAAYCRVSTAQEDQLHSLAQQRQYFSAYIARQDGWELVGIYADEGLSGTSSRSRPAFQAMLRDAQDGKIDLILTKEVSRFARNTVDALAHTRALWQRGVGVIFLSDGIDTRQQDGELRLTILASVAQEESRKTSQRVKWGQKRSMEQGVVFGRDNIYGFSLRQGRLTVKPDQAAVVRRIFFKFLEQGKGTHVIGRELYEEGVPTPAGECRPWSSTMVLRILRNEKYCGDLLQKKTYTPSFLDHKKAVNRGAEPQVLLRGHHEAIVSRAAFERAGRQLALRAAAAVQGGRSSVRHWCSGKLVCGLCGARLTAKRRTLACGACCDWVCPGRAGPAAACMLPVLPDEAVRACMAQVVAGLPVNMTTQCREVAALIAGLPGSADGEEGRLSAGITAATRRLDRLTGAFLDGMVPREQFERLRTRYQDERQRLGQALERARADGAPDRTDGSLPEGLRRGLHSPAVYGELLEKAVVYPGRLDVLGPAGAQAVAFRLRGRRPRLAIDCWCEG